MTGKAFLFVACVFGALLQIQSSAITKNVDAEFKRDVRYVQVEVDDAEYNLTLVQRLREVFFEKTPVWTIESAEGEDDYKIVEVPYKARQINGIFYEDDEHMTTLLATYDETEHEIYYNGLINIGTKVYKVESAVDDWWRNPDVSETSTTDESQLSENDKAQSEEKIEAQSSESDEKQSEEKIEAQSSKSDEKQSEEKIEAQSSESDEEQSEEKYEAQNLKHRSSYVSNDNNAALLENSLTTLYPKILAVVDYDLYSELGESVDKVIEYVATFWEAVDLKYSKLNSTDVKITVTGVLIVKGKDVSLTNGDMKSFNENFVKKTDFVNYDAAFIMSQSNVKTRQGQTQLGSICNRQNSVAFVEDNASYEGILSATHELGHLLNIPHDGLDRAEKCTVDSDSADSNVTFMSTGVKSTKRLTWSQCSRDIIQEFAKSKAATCLENRWRYE